jgi:hypothetical protein
MAFDSLEVNISDGMLITEYLTSELPDSVTYGESFFDSAERIKLFVLDLDYLTEYSHSFKLNRYLSNTFLNDYFQNFSSPLSCFYADWISLDKAIKTDYNDMNIISYQKIRIENDKMCETFHYRTDNSLGYRILIPTKNGIISLILSYTSDEDLDFLQSKYNKINRELEQDWNTIINSLALH